MWHPALQWRLKAFPSAIAGVRRGLETFQGAVAGCGGGLKRRKVPLRAAEAVGNVTKCRCGLRRGFEVFKSRVRVRVPPDSVRNTAVCTGLRRKGCWMAPLSCPPR